MAFEFRGNAGDRILVALPLAAASTATVVGLAITYSATAGYFKEVDAAAEPIVGIAAQIVDSPGANGDLTVLVDVSAESVYEVPADSGSVGNTLLMKSMDVGADGLTVDIDGSTTDDVRCIGFDADANTIRCTLRTVVTGV